MKLTLTQPDDWHVHLRDGASLRAVIAHTAERFGRAIVMPNLKPPVTTTAQAIAYHTRILAALPQGSNFQPLMTLYLTESTSIGELETAHASGIVKAIKYYPAGATTHSEAGVTDLKRVDAVLARMEEIGMPFLVHGEVTDPAVDLFDRERAFIDRELLRIVKQFPRLKIVFEHITTREAVDFVLAQGPMVGATITPQHLLLNRNAIFQGGIRPHYYCLPVLKRETHREALVSAATSGNPKFFLGTDSAPHARASKESTCGCAGMYTAHAAIELYAEAFAAAGALPRLEAFASHFGADFYGLPRNQSTITLIQDAWSPVAHYAFGDDTLIPFRAGETVHWRLTHTTGANNRG